MPDHRRLRGVPGHVGPARTQTFLAVARVHARDGRATFRAVAAERGVHFGSISEQQLPALRALGLITWDDGHRGTLRPLVEVVANG